MSDSSKNNPFEQPIEQQRAQSGYSTTSSNTTKSTAKILLVIMGILGIIVLVPTILIAAGIISFGIAVRDLPDKITSEIGTLIDDFSEGKPLTESQSLALQKVYLAYHSTEMLERGISRSECMDIVAINDDNSSYVTHSLDSIDASMFCSGDSLAYLVDTQKTGIIGIQIINGKDALSFVFNNTFFRVAAYGTEKIENGLNENYQMIKINDSETEFNQLEGFTIEKVELNK